MRSSARTVGMRIESGAVEPRAGAPEPVLSLPKHAIFETGSYEHRNLERSAELAAGPWKGTTNVILGRASGSIPKASFESGAPPYDGATKPSTSWAWPKKALKVGDRLPDFSLFNQDHVEVSSSALLRQGPLVELPRGHW